ncbi:hypothetical protein DI270_011675 [Microbispora triticiradicis]|uniref:Uncharacterized protein n=1 Tax=Microbispora triticiradicis TaxID=2200763 RepID=A0ABX9LLF4_9ACTN|nr:hypothetical protein DI270_011675 [Microbispora triticiradicis]
MRLHEARRFVMSLRARSALEFAWHTAPTVAEQALWQEVSSMDASRAIADRYRVTGAQEGPC